MARRSRFFRARYTRPLIVALVSAAVVGGVTGLHNRFGPAARQAAKDASPSVPATPATHPAAVPAGIPPAVVLAPASPKALSPKAQALSPKAPPARPSSVVLLDAPSTRPSGISVVNPKATPTMPVDAVALFKEADAKIAADDLIAARTLLVDALDGRRFSDTEQDAAFERLGKIAEVVDFSPRKFLSDPHQLAHAVQTGDNLQKIANLYDVTYKFIGRVNGISDPRKVRLGASLKIVKGPFHAIVNKTAFTLDLYQGNPAEKGAIFLKRLRVGLGEHDSTPSGLWKITTKLENPTYYNSRDTGPRVIPANDPANPLGERWLALEGLQGQAVGKESYGIHGTIDPASIGQKKSMGCVRLLNEDVNLVYDMLIKDKSTVMVVE